MAKNKTKKTPRQIEKTQIRQRRLALRPEHAHRPPRWKPLIREFDLELYRTQWLHRHLPSVLDGDPAPGSTTNLSWPDCPGQVPWGALKRIWIAEEATGEPDTRCLLCGGPLAMYGLGHLLFNGWWLRCCLDCGIDCVSGIGIVGFLERRRSFPLGRFVPGATEISFGKDGAARRPVLELEAGPLSVNEDGLEFVPLSLRTREEETSIQPKTQSRRQRDRTRTAQWSTRPPKATGTYAVASWDGRERSLLRVIWVPEEATGRPERTWNGWWYGISFECACGRVPEVWAKLIETRSAEEQAPPEVRPPISTHRSLRASTHRSRPSSDVRSAERPVTEGDDR